MKRILSFVAVFAVAVVLCCTKGEPLKVKTIENLKEAITGETTASAKYAAFAVKAREDKQDKIAILFEAASRAESFHAKKETETLEKLGIKMDPINPTFEVKTTRENLMTAIEGENYEVESMYPGFLSTAQEAKLDEAATAFDYALQVEKKHRDLYRAALAALESADSKNELKKLGDAYAVCPICGNTMSGNIPDTCDICGEPIASFAVIK